MRGVLEFGRGAIYPARFSRALEVNDIEQTCECVFGLTEYLVLAYYYF